MMFLRSWVLSACLVATVPAATVQLGPSADTYLSEFTPTVNAGSVPNVAAGTVNNGTRTRALLRFDIAGAVPPGAVITSVSLQLQVTRANMDAVDSTFELRRVLLPWIEQDIPGGPEGSTWVQRGSPDIGWIEPGALLGVEVSDSASATVPVAGVGSYTMASTESLVADVQFWLDHPGGNNGWMLRTQSEESPRTSRRFASREDAAQSPVLTLTYTEPVNPFRITDIERSDDEVILTWSGSQPDYQVQRQAGLGAPWEDVGPLTGESSMTFALGRDEEFFRVAQNETARYEVIFDAAWTAASHPTNYPATAHWSGLVGGVHNDQVHFFQEGETATEGIQRVAETGFGGPLLDEIEAAVSAGTAGFSFSGNSLGSGAGQVRLTLFPVITREHPLITVVTMVAPSPDWFVGVSGLSLVENGRWVDRKTVALLPFDAGTDSGVTYTSDDLVTVPRGVVTPLDPYPTRNNGLLIPFGTFTFQRIE